MTANTAAAVAVAPRLAWRSEALGALNATAAMLPFVLTFGFIVFGPLGPAAAQVGLTASVVAVVIGGAAMAAFSKQRMPAASPSASASLILGDAVVSLLKDPALDVQSPQGRALLLACTGLVVVAGGALLMLLGSLRAGSLVRFVPQPVLAGFMNGVAILIVVSQLPTLLGLPAGTWAQQGLHALATWQLPPLAVALATAGLMWAAGRRWPHAPAPFLALIVAGLFVGVWQAHAAAGSPGAALQQVGPVSVALPRPDVLLPLLDASSWALLGRHWQALAITAMLLALIGALESALSMAAIDQLLDARGRPNRELIALGGANIVSGLFGGLPLVYLRLRALSTLNGGGRSWRSVLLGCVLLAAVFTLGLPLLQPLATPVVAGVVVMLAWTLVDRWTRQLAQQWWAGDRSADLQRSLAIVTLVCAVTLGWGFVAGVGAGVLVATTLFIRAMNRQLVHARYPAADFPSRRVYAADEEGLLAPLRQRIEVIELEGALFFGSAERLLLEAERERNATTDLIIDLRRVSTVDASGAVALSQLAQRLARRGILLRLASVRPDDRHGRALVAHGVLLVLVDDALHNSGGARTGLWAHADLDRAIEAAERRALHNEQQGHALRHVPLAQCDLFEGLSADQFAALAPLLRERRLDAAQALFKQGEPGQALYFLTSGSISVVDSKHGQRFASFSPGMCFGETAVLDGEGRTADAVADVPSVVHEMPAESFASLQRMDPALAAQVYLNLAKHLSGRLRSAAAGWRRAVD